jgi:hypothetical protein
MTNIMNRPCLLTLVFGVALGVPGLAISAAQETEVLRLTPPPVPGDPFHNRYFGFPLVLDGEWLLTTDRVAGPGGEVYFYKETESGWLLSQVLSGTQAGATQFGSSIDADNGRLVVGSLGWRRGPGGIPYGKVDIFDLLPTGQWERTAELFPSGLYCPRVFGSGVAISGDTLVAHTTTFCPGQIPQRLHVYTLEASGWELQQTLRFNGYLLSAHQVGWLGNKMAIDGDVLVVGVGQEFGGALVFRRSGTRWSRVALLTDPETIQYDFMGGSVAIDGTTIVVGSDGGAVGNLGGAATVFEEVAQDQWVKTARLRPSDPFSSQGVGGQFGGAVAIDSDEIVVGAETAPLPGVGSPGKVYYFRKGVAGWPATETTAFVPKNASIGDHLGVAVDIRDGLIVGGLTGSTGFDTGYALLFGVSQGSSFCTTVPNSTGAAAQLKAIGSDVASEESLVLAVSDVPAAATGGFFASAGSTSRALFNGFLCLASPITRIGTVRQADPVGETVLRVDIDAISHLWIPAATIYLQYWHIDTIGQGTGLSNAIDITLR